MGKLLKFEFRRLLRSVAFYVFICIIVALNFLLVVTQRKDLIYRSNAILDSFKICDIVLLLAIFLPIYVCRNFTDGTIKTIAAKGYSMQKLYFTQLIVSLFVACVFCAAAVLSRFLFGLAFIKQAGDFNGVAGSLALQFAVIIALTCMFNSIAFSISKTGGSIAVNVLTYVMGSILFLLVDAVLYEILKNQPPRDWTVSQYWIVNFYDRCGNLPLGGDVISLALVGSLCYAAVFIALAYAVSRKREL